MHDDRNRAKCSQKEMDFAQNFDFRAKSMQKRIDFARKVSLCRKNESFSGIANPHLTACELQIRKNGTYRLPIADFFVISRSK